MTPNQRCHRANWLGVFSLLVIHFSYSFKFAGVESRLGGYSLVKAF